MSIQKKLKKLIKNPKLFFKDAAKSQTAAQQNITKKTPAKKQENKIDQKFSYWNLYKHHSKITNSENGNSNCAIIPIGIPYIDFLRVERQQETNFSVEIFPIWEYIEPNFNMEDVNYQCKNNTAFLNDIVTNLLIWLEQKDINYIDAVDDGGAIFKALWHYTEQNLVQLDSDATQIFKGKNTYILEHQLSSNNGLKKCLTKNNLPYLRLGGSDQYKLIMLPPRHFLASDTLMQNTVRENILNELKNIREDEHIVIICTRTKHGLNEPTARQILSKKHRKTIIRYDQLKEIDALLTNANKIVAPEGLLGAIEENENIKTYKATISIDWKEKKSREIQKFRIDEDKEKLFSFIPEKYKIAKKIIKHEEFNMIAVPDRIDVREITEGRQKYLPALLNARNRVYGAESNALLSDMFIQWGAAPSESKDRQEAVRIAIGAPRIYLEDGFIRSIELWTNTWEPTHSIVFDTCSAYYDSTKPTLLETLLNSDFSISEKQKARVQTLIERITEEQISKYNFAPRAEFNFKKNDKRVILIVDQKSDDMSIKYGLASTETFTQMLTEAVALGSDVEIVIKQHPCAMNGQEHLANLSNKNISQFLRNKNVHLINFDVNPYSLINAVDEVWVATSGMGFEALMAGKKVKCFGLPFYAGWGVTEDVIKCDRRLRPRSIQEIFWIFYIGLSKYVNPNTGQVGEIEDLIDHIVERVR